MHQDTFPRRHLQINGLSSHQVQQSKKENGVNEITQKHQQGFWGKFLENCGDPIIKILLAALCINIIFCMHESNWFESIGIGIAIILATLVSTLSEHGSEQTFKKMQKEAAHIHCKVFRDGRITDLPINEIVVGDHVLLQTGDRVPADGYILQGMLDADQSPLNGESVEVHKYGTGSAKNEEPLDINNPKHLFSGSIIANGEAVMIVTQVGDKTMYGNIAFQVQEKTRISPLKLRLTHLAKTVSVFGYISAATVGIAYMFNTIFMKRGYTFDHFFNYFTNGSVVWGDLLQAFMMAVVIIVMAVPEGLPMMITVVLSSNMKRMLKDNLLVRKLVSIETSGSLNILFTDKTGTLTQGELKVKTFVTGNNKKYESAEELYRQKKLWDFLALSICFNNEALVLQKDGANRPIGGNTTDRALLSYVLQYPTAFTNVEVVSRIPFSSANKFACAQIGGMYHLTLIKGAPEKILPYCTEYYDENMSVQKMGSKNELQNTISKMSGKAMRLLAVAVSETDVPDGRFKNLRLLGIIGIQDSLRPNAARGVSQVMSAGIQVVMITGDSMETAIAIARDTGLIKNSSDIALTSEQLEGMYNNQISAILPNLRVVARAKPTDKSRLVKIAQKMGLVVGMTGDGINDAPALKIADVGFSMGNGTEVAKEAGDIVILDNNLLSIANAVLYGRTIFKSVRKFIVFQLTVNVCAVLISALGPFLGIEMPITVLQMLWINIVIDTLAGLAFGGEPPMPYYMNEKPKSRREKIINKYMWNQIVITGTYTAILCLVFLKLPFFQQIYRPSPTNDYFLTAFFTLFLFAGIFNSFNARTHRQNIFANIRGNKSFLKIMGLVAVIQIIFIYVGGSIFRTSALTFWELILTLLLALTVIPVDVIRKQVYTKSGGERST